PRIGVGLRQLEAAARAAGRVLARQVAAAVIVTAVLVVVVLAQAEEPDEPDDQGPDVEDAQPDHEDPSLERHPDSKCKPARADVQPGPMSRRPDVVVGCMT